MTRLELVWPNKDRFLLVPKDDQGKPVWVDRDHPAAAEVRVSDFTASVGDLEGTEPYTDNLLFTGDSLDVLRILAEVPEYRRIYRGKVRLVYIDPPFNTGGVFAHYDDWLEHATWLSFMRDRLLLLKELLHREGSVWIHLDNSEVHRMRVLMDEVFGASSYLATVIWQRTSAKSLARNTLGTMHEAILVYGGSETATLQSIFLPLEDSYIAKRYTQSDERGAYDTGDLTATSYRPHLDSGQPWRGHDPSARRRCWAVPRAPLVEAGLSNEDIEALTMRQKLDVLDQHGYIHWPSDNGFPRFKKYLSRARGRAVGDLWTDITVINSQAEERTGFSTQKPEALIRRILEMTTKPGDIVIDCFAGSGTTAAVAHKMGRRWVTAELLASTVDEFTRPRLELVVKGEDPGGVTESVGWAGGGGFRCVEVGPSMYVNVPGIGVLLSDDATNGVFSKAVAGQLGYEFQPDASPLCGVRGRMRLAVLDGAVGQEEVRAIVAALNEGERVEIVGRAVLDGAEALLTSLAKGSRFTKAPRDLLTRSALRTRRRAQREAGE